MASASSRGPSWSVHWGPWLSEITLAPFGASARTLSTGDDGATTTVGIDPAGDRGLWVARPEQDRNEALHTCGGSRVSPPPMRSIRSR